MNTQNNDKKPMTILRSGVRRPDWVCRNVNQNVVLVRDRSGSMTGSKANDASAASLDLVAELADPCNKNGFNVAVVDFSGRSKIVHSLEKASALNCRVAPLSVGFFGGGTNITAGLEDAHSILEKANNSGQEGLTLLRPVVIVFTDGCHNAGPGPLDIGVRLKAIADIVTVAFGTDADEHLLREVASTPQHFYRCSSGRELRKFLAAFGATMSTTLAAGKNATQALSNIQ